jgi:hypothetical protein
MGSEQFPNYQSLNSHMGEAPRTEALKVSISPHKIWLHLATDNSIVDSLQAFDCRVGGYMDWKKTKMGHSSGSLLMLSTSGDVRLAQAPSTSEGGFASRRESTSVCNECPTAISIPMLGTKPITHCWVQKTNSGM